MVAPSTLGFVLRAMMTTVFVHAIVALRLPVSFVSLEASMVVLSTLGSALHGFSQGVFVNKFIDTLSISLGDACTNRICLPSGLVKLYIFGSHPFYGDL